MIEKEILQALQTAVLAAVAASSNDELPVKCLGRTFSIPEDGKWLEIVNIPNNIEGEFWDSSKTYRGILRLILHWPINDQGFYEPLDLIAEIADYFSKDTKLINGSVELTIYENPNLTGEIEQPPQSMFPVSIRYMCFKQSS